MSGVLIKLDRERKLKYTINSLSDFEESTGMSVIQIASNPFLMSSFRIIRAFIWAGLKWEEFKLTQEKAGVLIQRYLDEGGSVAELADVIKSALMQSGVMRDPPGEETEETDAGNGDEGTD